MVAFSKSFIFSLSLTQPNARWRSMNRGLHTPYRLSVISQRSCCALRKSQLGGSPKFLSKWEYYCITKISYKYFSVKIYFKSIILRLGPWCSRVTGWFLSQLSGLVISKCSQCWTGHLRLLVVSLHFSGNQALRFSPDWGHRHICRLEWKGNFKCSTSIIFFRVNLKTILVKISFL